LIIVVIIIIIILTSFAAVGCTLTFDTKQSGAATYVPDALHPVAENALSLLVELRLSSVRDAQADSDDDDDDTDAGTHGATHYHSHVNITAAARV